MKGNYTTYIIMPNTSQAKSKRITDRYDWTYLNSDQSEVTKEATVDDLFARYSSYFSPRVSKDSSEIVFKMDATENEINALPTGFTAYNYEEIKAYITTSTKWEKE